jgi:ParB/RepB/Spo0J family partition protein
MSLKEFDAADGHAQADEAAPTLKKADEAFAMLELALITPSLTNPRRTFNEAKMVDLADSIIASGVHQPILVRPLPANRLDDTFRNRGDGMPLPTHEIVSGERRYRASKVARRTTIPAMIRTLSDQEVLEIQIVENLQRDDLTELEEAEGYQRLCDETSIAKELVGERIGKSRSYVYGRMKLLDLTSAPREALRAGDIDGSKALLIARIPDEKLQIKALEAATEKDHQGSPRLSYRALQTWVQQNVMLKLSAARFSIVDASLVPSAGDCKSCSKRTGANPDLFADVDGPDVCTDPKCFHSKEEAHSTALVAIAKAKGMEVIEGREAKEVMPHGSSNYLQGYTSLDNCATPGGVPLRELLSPKEMKKVALLVAPESGELIEVIPEMFAGNAKARARQKNQSPKERKQDSEYEAKQERQSLALEYQKRWRTAAVAAIQPRVEAGEVSALTANMMRRLLLELSGTEQRCSDGDCADALGLADYDDELLASTIRACDDTDVGVRVILAMLFSDRIAQRTWINDEWVLDDSALMIDELAGLLGISIDAIKAEVQEQIRAERKAPAGDELAAQPEGSTKGEKSKSKPAAPARKGKTSKEEAAASIASALQELDAGPAGGQDSAQEKPLPQVSDRVSVSDPADDRFEQQGVVMKVRASGKASVLFDVDQVEIPMPFNSLQVIAAALWPFPRDGAHPAEPAKATLKSGDRVRVRAAASGYASEHHGKEGKVKEPVEGTTQWVVNLAKPKKAPKLVELEADVLEVLAP